MSFLDYENAPGAALEPCAKPSVQDVESFRFYTNDLFGGITHPSATCINDLNWLNVDDFLLNWHLFNREPEMQRVLRQIIESKWDSNANQRGLKHETPLVDHCLVFLLGRGADRFEMQRSHLITSCLRDKNGLYSPIHGYSRLFHPPQAIRAWQDFLRHHRMDLLFNDFVARIVLLQSPRSIQRVSSSDANGIDQRRLDFAKFYNSGCGHLNKLIKKGKIWSYLASCEVSCQSIRDSLYFPHIHAIVWTEPDANIDWLHQDLPDDVFIPKPIGIIRDWDGIKDFVRYIFQVDSIAHVYRKEWSENGIKEFNTATVNAWETMTRLVTGDAASRTFRRIRHRYLPDYGPKFVHGPYEAHLAKRRRKGRKVAAKLIARKNVRKT